MWFFSREVMVFIKMLSLNLARHWEGRVCRGMDIAMWGLHFLEGFLGGYWCSLRIFLLLKSSICLRWVLAFIRNLSFVEEFKLS